MDMEWEEDEKRIRSGKAGVLRRFRELEGLKDHPGFT